MGAGPPVPLARDRQTDDFRLRAGRSAWDQPDLWGTGERAALQPEASEYSRQSRPPRVPCAWADLTAPQQRAAGGTSRYQFATTEGSAASALIFYYPHPRLDSRAPPDRADASGQVCPTLYYLLTRLIV